MNRLAFLDSFTSISTRSWGICAVVSFALLFLVAGETAQAQQIAGIGVRAGYASGSLDISPLGDTNALGAVSAGVSLPIRFDEAFSLHPELSFSRKGGQFEIANEDRGDLSTQYRLGYVEASGTGRLHAPVSQYFKLYLGGGGYGARLLTESTRSGLEDSELNVESAQFSKLDYGLVGELGIYLPLGTKEVFLGARIDYGLPNLLDDVPSPFDAPLEARTRTLLFSVEVLL